VPYRLLDEVPELSHGVGDEGLLVQGDNLEALKALLPFYAGRVKCIYIDPPYNTRSAFEHYDDSLEHAKWLAMIVPRLMLLREFLAEDGSIWVSIDDNEGHYLKVVMDEIFGRRNFISNVIWQKRTSRENRAAIANSHDHILLYAKKPAVEWKQYRNLMPDTGSGYSNPDDDPRGEWRSIPFSAQGYRPNQMYEIVTPTGVKLEPPRGRCWGATEPEFIRLRDAENRIYWPNNGNGRPRVKKFANEDDGLVPMSLWFAADVGDNQQAKRQVMEIFDEEVFDTPKPERLIESIIHIATNPGDLVLDSFLGSGTTAAVAHKMGRRWIGVEMGDHARTHCALRMQKVIDGEQGGISKDVGWEGGGGFRFCTLGCAVFAPDGRVNEDICFADLARHIWFSETRQPLDAAPDSPLLGYHEGRAMVLLFNGILKDRSVGGGNVLTRPVLRLLRDLLSEESPEFDGELIVYGAACRLSDTTLKAENITFRQTPYEIPARA
jgi:adenine-specific DNA-methyltransferase